MSPKPLVAAAPKPLVAAAPCARTKNCATAQRPPASGAASRGAAQRGATHQQEEPEQHEKGDERGEPQNTCDGTAGAFT